MGVPVHGEIDVGMSGQGLGDLGMHAAANENRRNDLARPRIQCLPLPGLRAACSNRIAATSRRPEALVISWQDIVPARPRWPVSTAGYLPACACCSRLPLGRSVGSQSG